jgi:hypothetical protein
VSTLQRGDDDLHYSDNSHRWIAPPDVEQGFWEAVLLAHLDRHRTTMGGSALNERPGPSRPARTPNPPPAAAGSGRVQPVRRGAVPTGRR